MKISSSHRNTIVICIPILTVIFSILSIPLAFAFVVALCIGGIYFFVKDRWALPIVTVVLILSLLVMEITLRKIGVNNPVYYRPHEKYSSLESFHYKTNVEKTRFAVPFGDLFVLSDFANETIIEPRLVNFYTDSLGFRNRQDYTGQSLVLIGDSFGVGTGTTQEDILSEILTNKYGIDVYNASYPLDPNGYMEIYEYLTKNIGKDFKAIVLFFEGNDFKINKPVYRVRKTWRTYIPYHIRYLESYRFTFGLTRRLFYKSTSVSSRPQVTISSIGGKDVAFLSKYIETSKQTVLVDLSGIKEKYREAMNDIAMLVFIPTKYRVYCSLIDNNDYLMLPNTQQEFVREMALELGIPFVDLAPHLIGRSKELLKKGEYSYWRDDTHWNGNGMEIAAKAISNGLSSTKSVLINKSPP